MQQSLNIFFTIHLLSAALCTAMEIKKSNATIKSNSTIKRKITCIKSPQQAQYLRRDRIIIGSSDGCHIVNPVTNKKIIKICSTSPTHIAVHPDKKKLALSYDITIRIYSYDHDTDDIKEIWSFNKFPADYIIYSSIFSPFDETIITRHAEFSGLMKHNYTTGKTVAWNNPYGKAHPPKIAFHPEKRGGICLAHSSGRISMHEYNEMNEIDTFKMKNYHFFCKYNSNGSIIACGNRTSLYIVCPDTKKKHRIATKHSADWWGWWDCIAFHPNGEVLATLSSPSSILCYWDIRTRQLIDKISLVPRSSHVNNQSLCFLSNGIELMITFLDKCVIVPISFNVIYPPSTRKKLYYLLFLLKNYMPHSWSALPEDIITLLMHNILAVFRY